MKNLVFTSLIALTLAIVSPGMDRIATAAPPPVLALTLSTSAINFPDQDPDLFALSQQTGAPVLIILSTKNIGTSTPYSCSVVARGDMVSGPAIIPISNITWTAVTLTGDPGEVFFDGTLSRATAVKVAQGIGNDSRKSPLSGNLTFSMQNLWSYATGNYSQVVDFTITSP